MEKLKTGVSSFKTLTNSLKAWGRRQRLKKIQKLEKQSDGFSQQLIKKGAINQTLLSFIRGIEDQEKRKTAWRKLLSRKDLTPANYYDIAGVIDDESLKKEVQQKYVAIAPDDDLNYTIRYDVDALQEMALEEMCERIQKGDIRKSQARQILIKIFEDVPRYRKKVWDILKYLEPSDKELQCLLDLPCMDAMPDVKGQVERLIRKRPKVRDPNAKLIAKIQKTETEIQELKRGQK